MTTVDLSALVLPPRVWAQVLKLLASIEGADSVQALNSAHQYAQGFVLGLETVGEFLATDTVALCIGFDTAAQLRREELHHA